MTERVVKILAVTLAIVLFITGTGLFIAPKLFPDAHKSLMTSEAADGIFSEKPNTVDFLVIGDSETYTSVSPMEIFNRYGYTGYVSGVPAMKIQDIYSNLDNIYMSQQPKVILFEANAIFRKTGNKFKEVQLTIKTWFGRIANPFKMNNNILNSFDIKYIEMRNESEKETNHLKGFDYRPVLKAYNGEEWMHRSNKKESIPSINITYLNKIVQLCRQNGSELILYSAPAPKNWTYEKHNAIEFYAENNNLVYLDMNLFADKIGMDWSNDSADKGDHLNFNGALKTTAYIGDYFDKNCELKDHRGDARYDSWNKAWYKYLKETKQIN